MNERTGRPKRTLTVFSLVMITTGIITSILAAPSMAEYGLSMIVIYLLVALVFLLPSALISAELATGWPEDGGVYVWVKEAYGERLGFVAVWQQWIENVIWLPSILTVIVVAASYGFDPNLKDNNWFVFAAVNVVFWLLTLTNLFGMRTSSTVATICTIFGTILPILFIFTLAVLYVSWGNPSQCTIDWAHLIPNLDDTDKLSFIVVSFLTFAGIEASASNAASAKNPRRDYPIAIIVSASLALVLVILIALSIAIVVPLDKINLDAGIMQAIEVMFAGFGIKAFVPLAGLIIALGIIGEVNNWIPAPTRGLLIAGRDGTLSKFWQKENRYAVHQRILVGQGMIVSAISTIYLVFKVEIAFWLMTVVPTMLYIVMYFLMFGAAVRLRYSHPQVPRRYRVPFGNYGIWFLAIIGTVAGAFAIIFAFNPPRTVPDHLRAAYISVVALGFVIFTMMPFVIFLFRRPEWRQSELESKKMN
jgi:amino acid transporter